MIEAVMIETIKAFFEIVIWTFVPAMASIILHRLYTLPRDTKTAAGEHEYQLSIRAGFWGGMILFLIIFVAQVGRFVTTSFPNVGIYQGFNPSLALVAAIALFSLLSGKHEVPAKYRGWIVLGLAALSLWTFFHYLFIHTANEYILSLALGVALALFAHRMLHPIKHFL